MHRRKDRIGFIILLAVMFACLLLPIQTTAAENKKVDIVFTHDIHSYLESYFIEEDGEAKEVGSMARLATLIKEKKAENPDTLVLDAGDFSMGTLFHTMYTTEAIEYRMLGSLGFEATTFGNHEFDFGTEGLTQMFEAASEKSDSLAPIVVCNIDWDAKDAATEKIHATASACGLADYIMLQKGDVKVAVTGVLGNDAYACAPTCELTLEDPIESVKETVATIKEKENPDFIVCISHSGTWPDASQSEDELLAKAVPDLDVIISGHTHTTLEEPIVSGDTYIASCGAYGRNTGTLSLSQKADGRWSLDEYQLVSMDTSIEKDSETQKQLDEFKASVDTNYLSQFGYTADQALANNSIEFEPIANLETQHTEHTLGDIMSDAYRYAADTFGEGGEKVDVSVVPAGTVRGTYLTGTVTVENVFESFSLGNGPDGIAGYPLIKVYLTGEELRTAAEVDASISDMMTTARLYTSGLSFTYNPNRMILNKVTDISLNENLMDDTDTELEDKKLYCVVTDLYSGRMLSAVSDKSKGILKLEPKDADGNVITDFDTAVLHDEEGKEIKAWVAIASYFESFPQNENGISEVPSYYETTHNRKVVDDDHSVGAIIKSPGKYAKMIYGALVGMLVVLGLVILGVVKLCKRHRRRRAQVAKHV